MRVYEVIAYVTAGIGRMMKQATKSKKECSDEVEILQSRLDWVPDWIWEINLDAVIVYSNRIVKSLLGLTPDEILGKTLFSLLAQPDVEKCQALFDRAIDNGQPVSNVISHFRTKSGKSQKLELSCVLVFDTENKLAGFRGIARDVTDQFSSDRSAREAKANYQILVENSQTGIFIVQNGMLVYVNPTISKMMGYTSEEVLGTPILDYVHPEDAEWLTPYEQQRLAGEDIPTHYDARGITKRGDVRHFDVRSSIIGFEGEPAVLLNVIDITEIRETQNALLKSEQDHRDLIEHISDWVWQVDENAMYTYASPRVRDLLGYEPDEVLGRSVYEFMPREDAKRIAKELRPTWERHAPFALLKQPLVRRDRTIVWVETSGEPIFDEQGTFRGYRGIDRDITERQQAEEQLRKTTSEMETVLEAFPDIYFWIDADNKIIQFHSAEPSELYSSPEVFLGKSVHEALPSDVAFRLETATEEVRKTGSPVAVEYPLLMPDGKHFYEARLLPLPDNNVIAIIRNITERKLHLEAMGDSEERYRQLFEHSPDMVFLISAQTNEFIAMNPMVTRILGYAPREILGKTTWDISPRFQPDGERSEDKAKNLLRGQLGAPPQMFEWLHISKDGSLIECEVSLVYYRFHGEDLVQAIVRDITERKHSEETRRQMERDLDAQKRSFYRETILSVTEGKLSIVEQAEVEPYIAKAITSIEVNDYKEVAPARRAVEEFVMEHGITGDREHSFMVGVGEAITNAVKHGQQGKVYVGSDGESVWVTITDKGAGIESLILPRVVLMRGFSTKPSLGLGYSIMLEVSDRILLNTGEQGTTVVLMKEIAEPDVKNRSVYLPDTWDNVPG